MVGLWSLKWVWSNKTAFAVYSVLFAGIFLTGIGSGYYHLHPDNDGLVSDRVPMTLVFMFLMAATVGELIDSTQVARLCRR